MVAASLEALARPGTVQPEDTVQEERWEAAMEEMSENALAFYRRHIVETQTF